MLHTCPLDVQTVVLVDGKSVGEEVVLHGGVDLHDVPPLAPHVQVHYPTGLCFTGREHRPRTELHYVRPVLKGSSELGRVDGQAEGLVCGGANVDVGVLGHRGTDA